MEGGGMPAIVILRFASYAMLLPYLGVNVLRCFASTVSLFSAHTRFTKMYY